MNKCYFTILTTNAQWIAVLPRRIELFEILTNSWRRICQRSQNEAGI